MGFTIKLTYGNIEKEQCKNGFSKRIKCTKTENTCLSGCLPSKCRFYLDCFKKTFDGNIGSSSGGCGNCNEQKQAQTMSAYDQKIYNAQFGGCADCGSDERVKY